MKSEKLSNSKIGELLNTNKLAIFLEIIVIFVPFWLGIALSGKLGVDRIALSGDLVLIGGPLTYLGLLISLIFLWITTRLRGASWKYFGLFRPKKWYLVILFALGTALAILGTVKAIINPVLSLFPNAGFQDLSRFDFLRGDLPNLIIMLVNIWITAAFLEEFLFRGYLMNRITDLIGKQTKLAWAIALVGQALIFGLVHAYQSPIGMFKVGLIGFVFGLSYLAVGKNLWPLILAHGLIDSLDMISHFFGN